jgi:HSP20 family protein
MTEVKVTKDLKNEYTGMSPWFGPEAPLIRRGFFGVSPFTLMKHFTEEVDRMFGYKTATAPPDTWRPAIEVKEDKGNLLVTAELPGVKYEDVKVHLTGDALEVEGERKYEKEEKREGYFHTERSYGRFYRSIPVPEGANAEKATAQFNNGVLNVAIPIPEILPKIRKIPVTEGAPAKAETTH